jgi:hypothetical protein
MISVNSLLSKLREDGRRLSQEEALPAYIYDTYTSTATTAARRQIIVMDALWRQDIPIPEATHNEWM